MLQREAMCGMKSMITHGVTGAIVRMGALSLLQRFVDRFERKTASDGRMVFPFVKRRREPRLQILTYHRVNDEGDSVFPATPIRVFTAQMEFLARHCHVCPLETGVERLMAGDLPDNSVAITFDDGYQDNYLNAFPILKQLGITATIFLATDVIGTGRVLWHDRVFSAFRRTRAQRLERFGPESVTFSLASLPEKLRAQRPVLDILRRCGEQERMRWIERLNDCLQVEDEQPGTDLMLNWRQVKLMAEAGIMMGSHTMTHPILSRLDVSRVREEVMGSMNAIQEQTGRTPRAFAYPNGTEQDFNLPVKLALREAGYRCAVTTVFGSNAPTQDPFELRRGGPWEAHLPTFAVKMSWYRFYS